MQYAYMEADIVLTYTQLYSHTCTLEAWHEDRDGAGEIDEWNIFITLLIRRHYDIV